jgi:limonene-1,2-epoxide hydrolase
MDPDKIVREFSAAWERADVDAIMEAFTEDAVYHNIPMAPLKGKEGIRNFVAGLFAGMATSVRFDIKQQLVSGNVVMNERVDTLAMESGDVVLPVCGVFELSEEGKISGWRDYFDMGQFTGQSG